MTTQIRNINFTRGNSYGLQITLKTNIVEIKNIYFTVKDGGDNKLIEKKLDDGITFDDESGKLILRLKPNDTDNLLDDVDYKYDFQINYGLDDELTILKGLFIVSWKVTD